MLHIGGLGSSVGIVTGYGLDGPGSNPSGGEIFCTCPDQPWGPPSFLYNWYWVFPGGKERPGRDADPSPPSLCHWSRKSRTIPLLPLWAVWPIQSLSACTRVLFTFTFMLHIEQCICSAFQHECTLLFRLPHDGSHLS
jgi:hypothetical protein